MPIIAFAVSIQIINLKSTVLVLAPACVLRLREGWILLTVRYLLCNTRTEQEFLSGKASKQQDPP